MYYCLASVKVQTDPALASCIIITVCWSCKVKSIVQRKARPFHSLSAHHTKVKLKARPFPNQLRDEKELISRGQRSASNINIYISQYAPRTRSPGSCIVRLVSSGTRGEIRYLTRCSKRESTTHNLLIKYDRSGGSDPTRAPPPAPPHLA